jgi:hypothetical protein
MLKILVHHLAIEVVRIGFDIRSVMIRITIRIPHESSRVTGWEMCNLLLLADIYQLDRVEPWNLYNNALLLFKRVPRNRIANDNPTITLPKSIILDLKG